MDDQRKRRLRLAVIYGGRSAEHQVSVVTARSVMEALDRGRYEVVPVAITRSGAWLLPERSPLELEAPEGKLPEVEERGAAVALHPRRGGGVPARRDAGHAPDLTGVDVVFPLLHGPYGEDGTVQGLLELADLPYVGSGVLASALAMDKGMAKRVFEQAGLPVAPYVEVRERDWRADPERVARRVAERLTYPVFTKPSRLGSSIGVSKVHGPEELAAGLDTAFTHDSKVLVEQGLAARELECGVLGNDQPQASVVGEIVPCREFYDFEAKYLEESELLIPAPIPDDLRERVRDLAVRAFQALDCEGFARVDFFYDEAAGQLYLNEVNTIPGFTPVSMFPRLWAASGLPYPRLIDRLIELALERHQAKKG